MISKTIFRSIGLTLCLLLIFFNTSNNAYAQDSNKDLVKIQEEIDKLKASNEAKDKVIQTLLQEVKELQAWRKSQASIDNKKSALDKWTEGLGSSESVSGTQNASNSTVTTSPAKMRLIDISMNTLLAAGISSQENDAIDNLQGGAHDPKKRGFTLQQSELSLMGIVDPYFRGEAHIIANIDSEGESVFELEEAFLTSEALPYGLELEAGHFFTEFGRLNPQHPHSWKWLDQPVINSRLFGGDGMRAPGFRLGWLTPLPWYSELHFGAQNANGETMISFLSSDEVFAENPIDGRLYVENDTDNLKDLVYLWRWDNAWDLNDEWSAKLGVSTLFGPNASGEDGATSIYGTDFLVKWRPVENRQGWPFFSWETEFMKRHYKADDFFDDSDPVNIINLPGDTLKDWGGYSQILYGFKKNWAVGLRYDFAKGNRTNLSDRSTDPFRDDRKRISPLIIWNPSEFSRIRLQYNYDKADHLRFDTVGDRDRTGHSLWLGFEILFGAHPAHKY